MENNLNNRRNFLGKAGIMAAGFIALSSWFTKLFAKPVEVQSTPDLTFIGEIALYPYNFAPVGWQVCDGSLLPIAQYDALYTLIGTTYGGDGVVTFAVPDLRGRSTLHQGQGPGLSLHVIGESAGAEDVTLTVNKLPAHSHAENINNGLANTSSPQNNFISGDIDGVKHFSSSTDSNNGNTGTVSSTGGNLAHNNMQPYLVMTYCIAVEGIFPTHS